MGFKLPHTTIIAAAACAGVALVLEIVAVAAVGWATGKVNKPTQDVDVGLWQSCKGGICADLPEAAIEDHDQAVRAFAVIAILLTGGSLALGVLICFMEKKMLPLVAGALAFVAAASNLIAFAVYAGEGDSTLYDLSYCFALSVVSFVLCAASGVLFIFTTVKP